MKKTKKILDKKGLCTIIEVNSKRNALLTIRKDDDMGDQKYKHAIIRKRMIEKKITIKQLSKFLGISINGLSNKLSGDSRFYLDEAKQICEILDLTLDEIAYTN